MLRQSVLKLSIKETHFQTPRFLTVTSELFRSPFQFLGASFVRLIASARINPLAASFATTSVNHVWQFFSSTLLLGP
jgi:hypothetical protein